MKRISCLDCIHVEVCSIFHYNVKHLKDLNINFRVTSIADICPEFIKSDKR